MHETIKKQIYSETSVELYKTTRLYTTEVRTLHNRRSDNFRSDSHKMPVLN
jgi:hypothetical protein